MKETEKIHGTSGLTDEDLEFHLESRIDVQVKPTPVADGQELLPDTLPDDNDEIVRALIDCGMDSDLLKNPIFIKCYNQVADGPGRSWTPYRRTKFSLQTMNRAGALDIVKSCRPNVSPNVPPKTERKSNVEYLSHNNKHYNDLDVFGYRHLDRSEILGNLAVVGGVLCIVLLAIGATYLAISFHRPTATAATTTISLTAIIAAVIRLAGKWNHRFPLRYRMTRLVVCMILLFSTAAWWTAKGAWLIACRIFETEIDEVSFGLSMFGVFVIISLVAHLKLCRTYEPGKARILGWIEVLTLTLAIGAFLFCAVHKP